MKDTLTLNLKKKRPLSQKIFILCFILVPTVNFLIFYVYVNIDGFLMAFFKHEAGSSQRIWTLENFRLFFEELGKGGDIRLAFINTFKTFLINLIIFPWGIVVAYFLYKKIFGFKAFRVIFFLPSIINSIIIVIFYKNIVSIYGPIAEFVQNILKLSDRPDLLGDKQFANYFVWLHMLWLSFPGDMIIWGGAFARIPDSVIESAKIDGANWVIELVRIILPMIWPTFALKYIMLFSAVFSSSGAVFLLTNGTAGTMTFAAWQYILIISNSSNPLSQYFNYLSAIGLLVTFVAMIIVVVCKAIENRMFKDVEY